MKKPIFALSLSLACALTVNAQKADTHTTGVASSQTSAALNGVNLESGTRVTGELQNTLDARTAKIGDRVVLKTTQAIKSRGRKVVDKGAKLIGHVTEVAQKTKGDSQSRIGIVFDRLERGSLAIPISATISSLTSGRAKVSQNDEDVFMAGASGSMRSTTSTRGSSEGGGGLLGSTVNSTTSTVGGVVGGTTSAVGSTVDSTTGAVGKTARTLGRIQIFESSSTSVEGSSVLSLQGGNLRLDKGTGFNLVLTQSANAGASKDQ